MRSLLSSVHVRLCSGGRIALRRRVVNLGDASAGLKRTGMEIPKSCQQASDAISVIILVFSRIKSKTAMDSLSRPGHNRVMRLACTLRTRLRVTLDLHAVLQQRQCEMCEASTSRRIGIYYDSHETDMHIHLQEMEETAGSRRMRRLQPYFSLKETQTQKARSLIENQGHIY